MSDLTGALATTAESPAAAPHASLAPRGVAIDTVARGAPAGALDRPAGELLAAMPWEGASPDPDALDAATFLTWL